MTEIADKEGFEEFLRKKRGVLFYFATDTCSVGEAVEPKIRKLFQEKFRNFFFCFIDMNNSSELCASLHVFVEPTVLLFIDKKESLKRSRNINMIELETAVTRIYNLAYED